jgi:hypothetical protein
MSKASSFQQLPVQVYKTVLKPEIANAQNYRIFPTFINVKELALTEYDISASQLDRTVNPQNPETLMHTVYAYYFQKFHAYNGFEFKFYYPHDQRILRKTGLTRHEILTFRTNYKAQPQNWEVDANGDAYIPGAVGDKIVVQIPYDNYEITVKIPVGDYHYYDLDTLKFEIPFTNWTATVKWYLPDMGGTIA